MEEEKPIYQRQSDIDIKRLESSSQALQQLRQEVEKLEDEDNPQWDKAIDQVLALIDTKINEATNTQKETEKGVN